MSINLWPVFVEQETAPRNFDLWGSNHLEPIAKKYLTVLLTFKCFCLSNIEWFNSITNIPNIYFNTCYQHSALCFFVVAFSTKCYQIKNEVKYWLILVLSKIRALAIEGCELLRVKTISVSFLIFAYETDSCNKTSNRVITFICFCWSNIEWFDLIANSPKLHFCTCYLPCAIL